MTRRQWLGSAFGVAGGASFFGMLNPEMLRAADANPDRPADAVILLWMSGGMSHIDTFDPQPGTPVGGPFQAIKTNAEGIKISEHLPKIAQQFDTFSLIRSTTSNEAARKSSGLLVRAAWANRRGRITRPAR